MQPVPPDVDPAQIGTREQFAAAFSAVRERADLSVRELARRIGVPPGTLGDYFSGRHMPSVGQWSVLETALRACGIAEAELEPWRDAVRRVRAHSDGRSTPRRAPYRGLNAFQAEDADLFFGRGELSAHILRRLTTLATDPGPSRGVLIVIGPSGSGKSSVLRAGVVAGVRQQALGDGWTAVVTTPGEQLRGLEEALRAGRSDADPNARQVLVLDQFEEVFTYADAAAQRGRVLHAITERDPRDLVVIGMRADFYAAAAREPALLPALQHAQVVVGPMGEDELRAAIVGPAEHVGVTVEDGVVDVVLADLDPHDASGAAHDAGTLPLLSHALLAAWERSSGRRITLADYRATGGIDGAVQHTAEDLYADLSPDEQAAARSIFLRLVHLDGDVAVTRRRATIAELDGQAGERLAATATVLERFVERRLVTTSTTVVQISHEALLGAWPRLRAWIDTDRAGLLLARRLTDAANAWQEGARDGGLLLRGARLAAAEDWAAGPEHQAAMNELEREYLAASAQHRDARRLRERRHTRRLSRALVTVAVLALAAIVLAAFARSAEDRADLATASARTARNSALSRQVAIQAREIADTDPALAQQLAVAAYRISPTVEARSSLLDESTMPLITRQLGGKGPTALGVQPSGRILAVGNSVDGTVRLRSATGTLAQLGVVPGTPGVQLYALAFSPDGTVLATGGQPRVVTLWDVQDPAHPVRLATMPADHSQAVESLAFSRDGRVLVAAGGGSTPVREWDVHDPQAPVALAPPPAVALAATRAQAAPVGQSVAFSADGTELAVGFGSGRTLVWPWTAADRVAAAPSVLTDPSTVNAVAFDPVTRALAVGDTAGGVTVWSTGARPATLRRLDNPSGSEINALAWSSDGSLLAFGSADDTVQTYDSAGWLALSSIPHPGPVTGLAFVGARLVSTAADGAVRSWIARGPGLTAPDGSVFSLAYSQDGRAVMVARNGPDGGLQLWQEGPDGPVPVGPLLQIPGQYPNDGSGALRLDGTLAASGTYSGTVELWNTAVPARATAAGVPFASAAAVADKTVETLALSPDGRLLAVADDDTEIHLWSVADPVHPVELASVHGGSLMFGVAFSPDGRLLAGANADEHVYLWNIADPARPVHDAVLGGFANYVYGVAFSPNGSMLAASSADDTLRLWSVREPGHPVELGGPLVGPTDYVNTPAFSPDGTLLAAPSNDHTVWLWRLADPAHPSVFATLRAVDGNVFAAAFSPDGRTLLAGGRDTEIAAWTVDPARAAAAECAGAGTPISRAEWAEYVPGAAYNPPCR